MYRLYQDRSGYLISSRFCSLIASLNPVFSFLHLTFSFALTKFQHTNLPAFLLPVFFLEQAQSSWCKKLGHKSSFSYSCSIVPLRFVLCQCSLKSNKICVFTEAVLSRCLLGSSSSFFFGVELLRASSLLEESPFAWTSTVMNYQVQTCLFTYFSLKH